jgi:hypothetical protein
MSRVQLHPGGIPLSISAIQLEGIRESTPEKIAGKRHAVFGPSALFTTFWQLKQI